MAKITQLGKENTMKSNKDERTVAWVKRNLCLPCEESKPDTKRLIEFCDEILACTGERGAQ